MVVSCYRQEDFLPRTVAALERALGDRDWQGAIVLAAPGGPLPALSPRWHALAPPGHPPGTSAPLTPGAARMAGCATCGGEWVLFADADVEVESAWVLRAITAAEVAAETGAALAGIGGRLEEWFMDERSERQGSFDLLKVGRDERRVDYLTTPALYRREALLGAGGYDVRLSSEEDFELGLRMRRESHELRSLGMLAGRHWSAPRPSFRELSRRWQTGLCFGQGQVLRLYLGRPGFGTLLRRQWLYVAALGVWTLGLVAVTVWLTSGDARALALWALVPLVGLALMTLRKRSPRLALHSLLTWSLNGFGMLVGLFRLPPAARAAVPGLRAPGAGGAAC